MMTGVGDNQEMDEANEIVPLDDIQEKLDTMPQIHESLTKTPMKLPALKLCIDLEKFDDVVQTVKNLSS